MEIQEFIKNFASLFEETPLNEFEEKTRFRDLENWDSMVALSITAMVDEIYKVKISPNEMKQSSTIRDIFDVVNAKK